MLADIHKAHRLKDREAFSYMSDDKTNDLGINVFFKDVNQEVPVRVCFHRHSSPVYRYTNFEAKMLKLNIMKDKLKGKMARGQTGALKCTSDSSSKSIILAGARCRPDAATLKS
jgi:hypothetical protein